ncbi:myeloid leukemia factor 1 isoform X1 [Embiotoca jacksoni]|uniref:myeloid leukemia factor 1 isoform X1 n=1 Tax=Embiotoca jacksoni TaxID=100190 RepID=UPI00370436AA
MFNSSLMECDDDPLFSDPFRAHREHMRHMMRSLSEPFGGPVMPSIMDGRNRDHDTVEQPGSSRALRNEHRDMSRSLLPFGTDIMTNPFGMFDNMMANMRNGMEDMTGNYENVSTDSDRHSFSSSSVMTYSKVGNEPPKVYQATSSTRRAPGGIMETRQAVDDSESGLKKMTIGHHIQDRGHVMEKKFNKKTGEKEFTQDFQNMDEREAKSFDDEWQQEVSKFQPSGPMSHLKEPRPCPVHHAALCGPEPATRDRQKSKAEDKRITEGSNSRKQ